LRRKSQRRREMEEEPNPRSAVAVQMVWTTLAVKQQQEVLKTIVSICRRIAVQCQEEEKHEPRNHSASGGETTPESDRLAPATTGLHLRPSIDDETDPS